MTEDTPFAPPSEAGVSAPRRRLRWWFIGGFVIAFVGLLLFMRLDSYTGTAVIECKLWRFYVIELQRAFTSSGNLGPTSGVGPKVFLLFLWQLAVAFLFGLLSLGLGALIRRFQA